MGLFTKSKKDSYKIKDGVCTATFEKTGELTSERVKEIFELPKVKECKAIKAKICKEVTVIGKSAFDGCFELTSIEIPKSVTSIDKHAFQYCYRLTSILVAKDNEVYKSIDGNLYTKDGKTLVQYAKGKSETIFKIPESVTGIGEWAFSGCYLLTSIVIPKSVTTIGDQAFYGCCSLTSILVAEDNKSYKSIDGNLYTKDGKTLVQYAKGKSETIFKIPESVTSIGKSAFLNCTALTSIELPKSVTSIGEWAFGNCDHVTSFVIPESVTSIGEWAFYCCENLTIYCEAESQPSGWNSNWNPDNSPVVWGHKQG